MSNAPSLLEVTLFVSDVDRSAQFYRAVGVDLFVNDEEGGIRHYDGGAGSTALQLWPAADSQVSKVQLGFRVEQIRSVAAALEAIGMPYSAPSPNRLMTQDPDCNRLHIAQIREF